MRRLLLPLLLVTAFALGLAVAAALTTSSADAAPAPATAAQTAPCIEGTSIGEWNLPGFSALGHVAGKLVAGGETRYVLDAALYGTRLEGKIDGKLIDPSGEGVARAEGSYRGARDGRGRFELVFVAERGTAEVVIGKMAGQTKDPAGFPDPIGAYEAEWVVCP